MSLPDCPNCHILQDKLEANESAFDSLILRLSQLCQEKKDIEGKLFLKTEYAFEKDQEIKIVGETIKELRKENATLANELKKRDIQMAEKEKAVRRLQARLKNQGEVEVKRGPADSGRGEEMRMIKDLQFNLSVKDKRRQGMEEMQTKLSLKDKRLQEMEEEMQIKLLLKDKRLQGMEHKLVIASETNQSLSKENLALKMELERKNDYIKQLKADAAHSFAARTAREVGRGSRNDGGMDIRNEGVKGTQTSSHALPRSFKDYGISSERRTSAKELISHAKPQSQQEPDHQPSHGGTTWAAAPDLTQDSPVLEKGRKDVADAVINLQKMKINNSAGSRISKEAPAPAHDDDDDSEKEFKGKGYNFDGTIYERNHTEGPTIVYSKDAERKKFFQDYSLRYSAVENEFNLGPRPKGCNLCNGMYRSCMKCKIMAGRGTFE